MVDAFGDTCDDCGRHVQDWRGLAYEVERDRWEYLCPECAEDTEYLSKRGMDDVECPECGNKSDIERVGFHDVGSRRRKVLACNGCGHVYTRPAGRGDIGVMKDLYQHLTTAALQPIPDGWVMMPSSMIDDELEVVVFHAGGVVMDEFDGLGVGYEVEEIRGCDWVWKLAAV